MAIKVLKPELAIEGAIRITQRVAEALDYAHPQVVHRDVEPENGEVGRRPCPLADSCGGPPETGRTHVIPKPGGFESPAGKGRHG